VPGLRSGYEVWRGVEGLFPPDYVDQLDRLEVSLTQHDDESLRVVTADSTWLRASGTTTNRRVG
jgi:hypothetical protein